MSKYITKKGDTFWKLERRYGLKMGILSSLNPTIDPKKLKENIEINFPDNYHDLTKSGKINIHNGETFWLIEKKYNLREGALTELNPNIDQMNLEDGMEINFPIISIYN